MPCVPAPACCRCPLAACVCKPALGGGGRGRRRAAAAGGSGREGDAPRFCSTPSIAAGATGLPVAAGSSWCSGGSRGGGWGPAPALACTGASAGRGAQRAETAGGLPAAPREPLPSCARRCSGAAQQPPRSRLVQLQAGPLQQRAAGAAGAGGLQRPGARAAGGGRSAAAAVERGALERCRGGTGGTGGNGCLAAHAPPPSGRRCKSMAWRAASPSSSNTTVTTPASGEPRA